MKYDFDAPVNNKNKNLLKWQDPLVQVGVEDALPLWVADMDFETAPKIKEALLKRAQHGVYGYSIRSEGYCRSIIDWNIKRNGWKIEQNWITYSAGVVNALATLIRTFSRPEEGILIQPPVYHPFSQIIRRLKRKIVSSPLRIVNGQYIPDIKDFEYKIRQNQVRLFILCNPHNPVGRVFTKDELTAMGEICLKYRVLVVSDEIHSDLVYKDYQHIPFPLISEDFAQNSIVCTAPSKTFNLAGLSTANLVIPNQELKRSYDNACKDIGLEAYNIFGAVACEAGYTYGEEWLEQLLVYLEDNKNFALDYIRKRIPVLKAFDAQGTYFLWIDCRGLNLDKDALEYFLLQKARLWLSQGYLFGEEGEGFVRVNIACSRATLTEALNRLEKAVKSTAPLRR